MTSGIAGSAVLLVAHGSRVPESNSEIESLALRLAATLPDEYTVSHAFLELASPGIPETIDSLVEQGTRRIVVIPYFLSAGRHVTEDIPAIIDAARERHPDVDVRMTGHFGARDDVPGILSAMALGAGGG